MSAFRNCTLCIWLLVAIAAPGTADAQEAAPVTIRSGDHGAFTRLVLAIPDGAAWQLGRSDEGYLFRVDGAAEFDTSGVFERIPRTRIRELRGAGGDLEILMACDCHADAFAWRPDRIVVDILDGPPVSPSFEARLPLSPEAVSAITDTGVDERPRLQLPIRFTPDQLDREYSPHQLGPLVTAKVAPHDPETAPVYGAAASGAITRALSLGLLMPAEELGLPNPETVVPRLGFVQRINPVTMRTPLDRDRSTSLDDAPSIACHPEEAFRFHEEANSDDFSKQLAIARGKVVTESGAVDADATLALARFLIGSGLGLEARQVLRHIDSSDSEPEAARVYAAMADLLIRWPQTPDDSTFLMSQMECHIPGVLWAVLAGAALPEEEREVLTQFIHLPKTLRRFLAIGLAQRFSDHGSPDLARQILDLGGPVAAVDIVTETLMREELMRGSDSTGTLRAQLIEMAEALEGGRKPKTSDVIALVSDAWQEQMRIPSVISDYITAQEEQFSSDLPDPALATSVIRAALLAQAYEQVPPALRHVGASAPDQWQTAASEVAIYLTQNAEDTLFLTAALSWFEAPLPRLVQEQVDKRLDGLGFGASASAGAAAFSSPQRSEVPEISRPDPRAPISLSDVRSLLAEVDQASRSAEMLLSAPLQ